MFGCDGLRLVARCVVVAATAALALACTPTSQPPGNEAEPTPAPWPNELRYEMFDQEICDEISLVEIFDDFDMAFDELDSSLRGPGRIVRCAIKRIDVGHPDEHFAAISDGELALVLFQHPEQAYANYDIYVDAEAFQNYSVAGMVDGWWTEGVAKEYVLAESGGYRSEVLYNVVHENLVVTLLLLVSGVPGTDRQDAVGTLHEVAMAVLDEVKEHLPCTSLVEPPVPGCD